MRRCPMFPMPAMRFLPTPRKSGGLSKTWAQAISPNGTKTSLGLGSYPVVTLAMARDRALANARSIAEGRDPRRRAQQVPTFTQANETVLAIHAEHWKSERTEGQWRASMRDDVLPRSARKRVDAVTTADVMAVLLPIWSTKRVTAGRVRQRIGAVMKWAVAQGYRDDNPAGDAISAALPKAAVRKQHIRALPHAEVGAALARVKDSGAYPGAMLALEFLVLAAARSGEVRNARWEQIDRDGAVWTIPAERMKAGREHRVPLSPRELEVLDGAAELFDGAGLVFPSPTGRVLNHAALTDVLHGLGIDAVAHGFRSSFRDRPPTPPRCRRGPPARRARRTREVARRRERRQCVVADALDERLRAEYRARPPPDSPASPPALTTGSGCAVSPRARPRHRYPRRWRRRGWRQLVAFAVSPDAKTSVPDTAA